MVKLTFTQFRLEDGTSRGCGFDWLAVRDGDSQGTEMGRYCGHDLPGDNGTIITTRNIATLEFRSEEITLINIQIRPAYIQMPMDNGVIRIFAQV